MRVSRIFFTALVFLVSFNAPKLYGQTAYNKQWPGFRGPFACGFIEDAKTAVTWNVENSKNIKWKTAIPGMGHSSPVIWDDKIFVTTASSEKKDESLKVGLYGDIAMANDPGVSNVGELTCKRRLFTMVICTTFR